MGRSSVLIGRMFHSYGEADVNANHPFFSGFACGSSAPSPNVSSTVRRTSSRSIPIDSRASASTSFNTSLRSARKTNHIPFIRDAKKALELSLREALARKDDYIGTEHILPGILRAANGVTREVLEVEVGIAEIRRRLQAELDRAA